VREVLPLLVGAAHVPLAHRHRLAEEVLYTPLAVAIALAAWAVSGRTTGFLAVLVVATPCPLPIAIPVAIIGSISLAARRGIIIKDPGQARGIRGAEASGG
jgi:cation transport ATPase